MAYKLINATEVRNGTVVIIDGEPCMVRSFDVSKTGKHGHAKVRTEAISILSGKKKVVVKPGHDKFEVPMINKNKAQVLSVNEDKASVMDLTSYETIDIDVPDELKGQLNPEEQVEYWDIEGTKIIKRKL